MLPQTITEFAHAKINLALHVTGQRDDGYHLLDSLVVFAGIGDGLRATRAEALGLTIDGPFAAARSDRSHSSCAAGMLESSHLNRPAR